MDFISKFKDAWQHCAIVGEVFCDHKPGEEWAVITFGSAYGEVNNANRECIRRYFVYSAGGKLRARRWGKLNVEGG